METTGLAPETADNTASAAATEVDSEVATTDGADPAPAAAETGKPERDKVQERFDKLTREKYEGLSRAERAEWRAQELERRLQEIEARAAKTETVAPSDPRPTLESCEFDEARLDRELDAWYDRKLDAKAEGALSKREQAAEQERSEREWSRREAEFIKSKPDYFEKVYREPREGGPSITEEMAGAAKRRGSGAEVLYYLAENVEKSREIARMHPLDQAVEIGRIEARLEAAKAAPPPVSKAPPPTQKIDAAESAGSVSTTDPASDKAMSDDQWFRAENKRVARKAARQAGR